MNFENLMNFMKGPRITVDTYETDPLYSDDINIVESYLSGANGQGFKDIDNHHIQKGTPLFHACSQNRNDVVDLLIKFGANINKVSCWTSRTPLFIASARGHVDVVSRLVQAKANPNIRDRDGSSAIMEAAKNNHLSIVQLLTPSTDFNIVDNDGFTIFNYALWSNNNDMINYVFDYCTNINHVDNNGKTYLHHALELQRNQHVISLLLNKGIDISIQNNNGKVARDLTKNPEILSLLS